MGLRGFAMLKTRPAKEVVIRVPNAIGTLNEIARTMADKGINILAISAWVEGTEAVIRLVTDDSVRVLDALRAHKYDAREADVLVTEPSPREPNLGHAISVSRSLGTLARGTSCRFCRANFVAGDIVTDSPELSNPAWLAGSTGNSRAGCMSMPVTSRIVQAFVALGCCSRRRSLEMAEMACTRGYSFGYTLDGFRNRRC
jgi:hypothetical protein